MKQKEKLIKMIVLDDEYVVYITKKPKTEPKKCSKCKHMKICDPINRMGYCSKHNGIVSFEDTCIEEYM